MANKSTRSQSQYTSSVLQDATRNRHSGKSVKALIGQFDQNDLKDEDQNVKDRTHSLPRPGSKGEGRNLINEWYKKTASVSEYNTVRNSRQRLDEGQNSREGTKTLDNRARAYSEQRDTTRSKSVPRQHSTWKGANIFSFEGFNKRDEEKANIHHRKPNGYLTSERKEEKHTQPFSRSYGTEDAKGLSKDQSRIADTKAVLHKGLTSDVEGAEDQGADGMEATERETGHEKHLYQRKHETTDKGNLPQERQSEIGDTKGPGGHVVAEQTVDKQAAGNGESFPPKEQDDVKTQMHSRTNKTVDVEYPSYNGQSREGDSKTFSHERIALAITDLNTKTNHTESATGTYTDKTENIKTKPESCETTEEQANDNKGQSVVSPTETRIRNKSFSYEELHKVGDKSKVSGVKKFVDSIEKAKSNISTALQKQVTQKKDVPSWKRNEPENRSRMKEASSNNHGRSKSDRETTEGKLNLSGRVSSLSNYPLRSSQSQSSLDNDNLSVGSLNEYRTPLGSSGSTARFSTYTKSSRHRRREKSQNNDHGKRSASVGKISRDTSPWISNRRQARETHSSFEDTDVFTNETHTSSPRHTTKESSENSLKSQLLPQPSRTDSNVNEWFTQNASSSHSTQPDANQNSMDKVRHDISGTSSPMQDADIPLAPQRESLPSARVTSNNVISPKPFVRQLRSSESTVQPITNVSEPNSSFSEANNEKSPSQKPIDISKYLISPPTAGLHQDTQLLQSNLSDQNKCVKAEEDVNKEKRLEPTVFNQNTSPDAICNQDTAGLPITVVLNEIGQPEEVSKKETETPPPLPMSPPPNILTKAHPTQQTSTFVQSTNQLPIHNCRGDGDIADDISDSVFLPNLGHDKQGDSQLPTDENPTEQLKEVRSSDTTEGEKERQHSWNPGGEFLKPIEDDKLFKILSIDGSKDPVDSKTSAMQGILCHKIFRFLSKNLQHSWIDFMSSLFETYPEWFIRWKEGDIKKGNDTEEECMYSCLVLWRDMHADFPHNVLIDQLKATCSNVDMALTKGIDDIIKVAEDTTEKYLGEHTYS